MVWNRLMESCVERTPSKEARRWGRAWNGRDFGLFRAGVEVRGGVLAADRMERPDSTRSGRRGVCGVRQR